MMCFKGKGSKFFTRNPKGFVLLIEATPRVGSYVFKAKKLLPLTLPLSTFMRGESSMYGEKIGS